MKSLKDYAHCITCRHFLKCQRKFFPDEKEIFTSFSSGKNEEGEPILIFSNSVWCVKPRKN